MEAADLWRSGGSSSFAAACSALGQCIKAKGSVADLGLAAVASPKGKVEVLLPGKEATASAMDADAREPEKAALTIFYDGKVLVFDGFPVDKAKNLMR